MQLYDHKGNESLKMDLQPYILPLLKGLMIYFPPSSPAFTRLNDKRPFIVPIVQKILLFCGTWESPISKGNWIILIRWRKGLPVWGRALFLSSQVTCHTWSRENAPDENLSELCSLKDLLKKKNRKHHPLNKWKVYTFTMKKHLKLPPH